MFLLHKPRQLNPVETSNFVAKHATLPPDHQADVALKWRERFVNVATAYAPSPLMVTGQLTAAATFVGAMGHWDGINEAKRVELVEAWRDQAAGLGVDLAKHPTPFQTITGPDGQVIHKGVPDPRAFFYVNKVFWPSFGMALVAGVGSLLDRDGRWDATVAPFLKTSAISGGAYLIGSTFRDMAFKRAREKQEAIASGQSSSEDAARNPWRRYSQAA